MFGWLRSFRGADLQGWDYRLQGRELSRWEWESCFENFQNGCSWLRQRDWRNEFCFTKRALSGGPGCFRRSRDCNIFSASWYGKNNYILPDGVRGARWP